MWILAKQGKRCGRLGGISMGFLHLLLLLPARRQANRAAIRTPVRHVFWCGPCAGGGQKSDCQ